MALRYWGRELLLNARKCNSQAISNPRIIELFLQDMVKKIDMKAYGRPMIEHFGEGNKSGYTAIQLIETSNIILHLCDETGDGYFNIFSCKHFSENVARVVVEEWFKPEYIDMKVVDRDAKFPMA
tara:strand:- start:51 stop:425 length:375 start_codon:yes stop_codon:yes gene_type:complete